MKLKEGQWLEFEDGSKALAEDVIHKEKIAYGMNVVFAAASQGQLRKEGSLQWATEDMDLRGIRSWLQSIADGHLRAPLTWFDSVFFEALSEALSALGGDKDDD